MSQFLDQAGVRRAVQNGRACWRIVDPLADPAERRRALAGSGISRLGYDLTYEGVALATAGGIGALFVASALQVAVGPFFAMMAFFFFTTLFAVSGVRFAAERWPVAQSRMLVGHRLDRILHRAELIAAEAGEVTCEKLSRAVNEVLWMAADPRREHHLTFEAEATLNGLMNRMADLPTLEDSERLHEAVEWMDALEQTRGWGETGPFLRKPTSAAF